MLRLINWNDMLKVTMFSFARIILAVWYLTDPVVRLQYITITYYDKESKGGTFYRSCLSIRIVYTCCNLAKR